MGKGRTNWKWVLVDDPGHMKSDEIQFVPLWAPEGLRHPYVGEQANTACLWAEVDPGARSRWYRVAVVSTGQTIPDGAKELIGRCILTVKDRKLPTPVDNSVKHCYLMDETAEVAALAARLPLKGLAAGAVIEFPMWKVEGTA